MKLRDWLKKNDMTQCEFARRVGVTKASVCHWLKGKTSPNRNTQKRIREVTNGAVTQEEVCEA